MTIEQEIEGLGRSLGATAVGIGTTARLPALPSADPASLLPGARSLVSVMVHYDPAIVEAFLARRDRVTFTRHETELYRRLDAIATGIATLLERGGQRAVAGEPNLDYRYKRKRAYRAVPHPVKQRLLDWLASDARPGLRSAKRRLAAGLFRGPARMPSWRLTPSFAHRYGAVAAGLGTLGWSGNVLHPEHGARVLFTTVLTNAELEPHAMLDAQPCDGCRLCARSCQSGFIHERDSDRVELGDRVFVHNRKASNLRCILVCGGFTGQSRHPGWSTWCEGRVELPQGDGELQACWDELLRSSLGRASHGAKAFAALAYHSEHGYLRKTEERFQPSCGYCQLVCAPTRQERRALFQKLTTPATFEHRHRPPEQHGSEPREGQRGDIVSGT